MYKLSPRPIMVNPLDDYKLQVTFADNKSGIFDMKPLLTQPPFKSLVDIEIFNTAHISLEGATIEFINGVDICPDQLYLESM